VNTGTGAHLDELFAVEFQLLGQCVDTNCHSLPFRSWRRDHRPTPTTHPASDHPVVAHHPTSSTPAANDSLLVPPLMRRHHQWQTHDQELPAGNLASVPTPSRRRAWSAHPVTCLTSSTSGGPVFRLVVYHPRRRKIEPNCDDGQISTIRRRASSSEAARYSAAGASPSASLPVSASAAASSETPSTGAVSASACSGAAAGAAAASAAA